MTLFRSRKPKHVAPKPGARATLQVESLDQRLLPSVTLLGGQLRIVETDFNDRVEVREQTFSGVPWVKVTEQTTKFVNSPYQVTLPQVTSWYQKSQVASLYIEGLGGNDSLANHTSIRSTIKGGDGNDVMLGGSGTDYLYGGYGNDKIFARAGYDYLYGEIGNDFLDHGGGANYISGGADRDFDAYVTAINGATKEDIQQASSPTCGCLSAIGAVANTGQDLSSLITYLGAGASGTDPTYQVRLYIDGAWRNYQVSFNGDLVQKYMSQDNGSWINSWYDTYDAMPVDDASRGNGCEGQSWVTILQRAYLQAQGVNWRDPDEVADDGSCDPGEAMTAFTGVESHQHDAGWFDYDLDADDRDRIINALNANKPVVVGTFNDQEDVNAKLVARHAYTLVRAYQSGGVWYFELRNPWGRDGGSGSYDSNGNPVDGSDDALVTLSWSQFRTSIEDYWING